MAEGGTSEQQLDFRKKKDRESLQQVITQYTAEGSSEDFWNQESILLRSFLKGYPYVSDYLKGNRSGVLILEGENIVKHQEFVSNDHYAIFMNDVLLEWPKGIEKFLEFADCQGIDSPNPLHFAMVQEYLAQCSQVLYVISSRTGLRQADFVLLKTLRQLGLLEKTIFVINVDLNECDTLEEWEKHRQRICGNLSKWVSEPQIFMISALAEIVPLPLFFEKCE